jgi:gamma-glutamylcyclotransferase (GGCT)/AIG2-like uncharacterized protein YtfP
MLLFVYGTLRKDQILHGALMGSKCLGLTTISGYYLKTTTGLFPIAHRGEGYVVGEVYKINDEILRGIDRMEGYNPNDPDSSFYQRVTISTEFGDAYIYTQKDYNIGSWKFYDWLLFTQRRE